MMFRRLYWVTEEVGNDGSSAVTGVYTSIPELVNVGIESRNGQISKLRLNLVKLDCSGPLATWQAPEFGGVEERLQEFVRTDEFSADHCKMLVDALKA